MKEPGKLENGIDKIKDKYVLEAMEYDEKRRKAPHWKGWIAAAACVVLCITGFFAWQRFAGADHDESAGTGLGGDDGAAEAMVITIDANTLLSGNGGSMPIELKIGKSAPDDEQGSAENESEDKTAVTLLWAYHGLGGRTLVSHWTERALNQKLFEDGYPFRIKFLAIKNDDPHGLTDKEYQEKLFQSGADIAFTGTREAGSGEHFTEEAVLAGKYEPLNAYLEESEIYDMIPKVLWDSTSYRGKVYFFPSEIAQNRGKMLFMLKDSFSEEEAKSFDGDLFAIREYLESGKTLLYRCSGFDFMEAFGYTYYDGVLFGEDGKARDPLQVEECVEWLRLLNEWYQKGQVTKDIMRDWDVAYSSSASDVLLKEGEDKAFIYQWKGYVAPRFSAQTGILSTSEHKKEAFEFLELLRVDPSYGKLLLYGKEGLDEGKQSPYLITQFVFGLDTGLVENTREDGIRHFATYQEKLAYYEENTLPSTALYAEFPMTPKEKVSPQDICETLIYSKDFEADLKMLRKKK